LTTAPYLNKPVYLYHLFTDKELSQKKEQPKEVKARENLKSYTQRTNTKPKRSQWTNLQEMPHEVWELATFKNEIDLHIEKLTDNPQKGQILSTQMRYFEQYMDRAIRVGAERVFIIHGLGEGKLRDAVAKRLAAMPEVKSFANDYHPLYGYGATEVVF
ncbi:MAG: Smr/MutS family protein, partial [Bacteroidota bacterium]